VSYLGPGETQLGKKETVKDTARVLGRMYDGIEFRGFSQQDVETWPRSPEFRSGTGSPTSGTRHRCWRTC
jgi:ornithine carbamoyltransferase